MKRNYTFISLLLLLIVAIVACSNNSSKSVDDNEETTTKSTVNVPPFNADSAYLYVRAQADFGPRVPNTAAHKACGEFLANKLEQFGAKVYNQNVDLVAYDNTILKSRNIIGAYNPESKRPTSLPQATDHPPNLPRLPRTQLAHVNLYTPLPNTRRRTVRTKARTNPDQNRNRRNLAYPPLPRKRTQIPEKQGTPLLHMRRTNQAPYCHYPHFHNFT